MPGRFSPTARQLGLSVVKTHQRVIFPLMWITSLTMLTARDVLSTSDSVAEVFKIGLSDANITTDFAKSADVAEIALMVLRRQGEFVFKLTGYLLRGITCLYYKKTVLVLENCEEIMMRISLRFEEAKKKASEKRQGKKLKQVTLDHVMNIDALIDAEKERAGALNLNGEQNIFEERNRFEGEAAERDPRRDLVGNDFGGGQFELDSDSDGQQLGGFGDLNYDMPAPVDESDGEFVNLSKKCKSVCQIDETPVIPMTQLSAMMDDPSATLCKRPICRHEISEKASQMPISAILESQYAEAKELSLKTVYVRRDPKQIEPDFVPEMPDEENEDEFCQPMERDQVREPELDEKDVLTEVRNIMVGSLRRNSDQVLTDIIQTRERRALAVSFMAAIRLHNQQLIRLHQANASSPILVSRGARF